MRGRDMRILRPLAAAAMLVAVAAPAGAQEELPVLGQGNVSCSAWLDRRTADAAEADTMVAWILGYITAFNQYAADPQTDVTGGLETEALSARIDDFCRENSAASLYQASAALVEELRQEPPR
jgi:hypothetical protein